MPDPDRLSSLVGDIYDAVLDQSLWINVLRNAAEFVGSQAGGLLSKDAVSKSANIHYGFGVAPHYMRLYVDTYAKLDPTTTPMFLFDVCEVASTIDLVPYEEFLESQFYKEWGRPRRALTRFIPRSGDAA